jgi:hypothetical protein
LSLELYADRVGCTKTERSGTVRKSMMTLREVKRVRSKSAIKKARKIQEEFLEFSIII